MVLRAAGNMLESVDVEQRWHGRREVNNDGGSWWRGGKGERCCIGGGDGGRGKARGSRGMV